MASVVYKNAKIFVNGALINCNLHEFGIDYSAEILDATTLCGTSTRQHKGGLNMAQMNGRGYIEFGQNSVEQVLFNAVGVDGTVITVFPDGITEGSSTPGSFSMKAVIANFNVGGQVGQLLGFDFQADCQGIEAGAS